jgi:GT2 family glycosyltransferase
MSRQGGDAGGQATVRVAAVMTAFNRRDLTLGCVESLTKQSTTEATLDIFVTDDASSDGTAAALRSQFPDVTVLDGTGDLFWNGGMRLAFGTAIQGDYDYYLWMNDDTHLDDDAVARLLEVHRVLETRGEPPAIVVGATRDPETGELTYSGVRRPSRVRRLNFEIVKPGSEPRRCDTMNGNCVLIPREVVQRVGNLDPAFIQKMGDFDYGLRATAAGCSVWIAPGTIGTCAANPPPDGADLSFIEAWRLSWSTKQLAPGPWRVFSRRWAGRPWPVYWVSPYLRAGLGLSRRRVRGRLDSNPR